MKIWLSWNYSMVLNPIKKKLTKNIIYKNVKRIVDIGAYAIIQMLYKDGFFSMQIYIQQLNDNGWSEWSNVWFIDLGMVGRFEETTRKAMLYYFNSLVMATQRMLLDIYRRWQKTDKYSDLDGFQKRIYWCW